MTQVLPVILCGGSGTRLWLLSRSEPMQSHINVGFGSDLKIAKLAKKVAAVVGNQGRISFDLYKPDGAARKWMSSECLNKLGWSALVGLDQGLGIAYKQFIASSQL